MAVTTAGNVGIGTTGPAMRLHAESSDGNIAAFSGTTQVNSSVYFVNKKGAVGDTIALKFGVVPGVGSSNFNKGAIIFERITGSGIGKLHLATDNTADGSDVDLSDARLTIDNAGNVGIGTTGPGAKLHVSGCTNPTCAQKPGGGSWDTESDARLKDIKKPFERGLAALERINPIYYRYKDSRLVSDRDLVGVKAQEVQEAIPEAVSKGQEGYLLVNNDPILWTMLNAIKEQEAKIARLEAEIKGLKGSN